MRVLVLLITFLLLTPALLRAQGIDRDPAAEEVITHAKTLSENGDVDGAVRLLARAVDRFPTYARMYVALAGYQQVAGMAKLPVPPQSTLEAREKMRTALNQPELALVAKEMFETYGKATMYVKDVEAIRQRVSDLTANELPTVLGEYGPLALPADPAPFSFTLNDPRLPTELRGTYQAMLTGAPLQAPAHYRRDPKYSTEAYDTDPRYGNWQFRYILPAYGYNREKRQWELRFRVMWQDVPGKLDSRLRLARQTAMLLLRCYALTHAYTGLGHRFAEDGPMVLDRDSTVAQMDGPINVWLTEKGEAGGESYNNNIYLEEIEVARTPIEWVREITHEYGHQTLPPVGGYAKPEWGANGVLGERLMLRWLLANREAANEPLPWLRDLNAQEVTDARITPLLRHFATLGPEAPMMRATERASMDGFVGMALYLESIRGSDYLLAVMKGMTSPQYAGTGGFLEGVTKLVEDYAQSVEHPVIRLNLAELPPNLPLWVYLRPGVWRGEVTRGDANPARMTVEIDGRLVNMDENGAFRTPLFKETSTGWHRITLKFDGNAAPMLSSLRLIRQ